MIPMNGLLHACPGFLFWIRRLRWIVLSAVLAGVWVRSATADQRPPNVLVILTDDQRWDAMSCAGNRLVQIGRAHV